MALRRIHYPYGEIYPFGYFLHAISYNKETGQGIAADGFPQLAEWEDTLESIVYEPNFSFWIKDEENITFNISLEETNSSIDCEDIAALPAGEYIIACTLYFRGDYIEKANAYNSSASVYWFKLIKP